MTFREFLKATQTAFLSVCASVAAVLVVDCVQSANAQALAPNLPQSMIAGKGETKNNSITSGSRSSLSLSSSTNLGSNSSVSAQGGYTAASSASLAITSGSFTSSFGKLGVVDVDIRNIRTEGIKSGSVSGSDYTITPETGSTAQGQALVKGMSSDVDVKLDPATFAKSETGQIRAKSVNDQGIANENVVPGNSNASSGHSMNSAMNVDISNTSFSQSFSQAF